MKKLFNTPGRRLVTTLAFSLIGYYYIHKIFLGGIGPNINWVIFDCALLLVVFLFSVSFFSQFTLPLRTVEDRLKAFQRVLASASGSHGPAIFIKNGKKIARRGEAQRKGPGVVILDTASGAMLTKGTEFTRPVGPGVEFTSRKEYIHETLNLFEQTATLGPKEKDRDPFIPILPEESHEEYEERQYQRIMTSGFTRDGVEVVPDIHVSFRLKSKPGKFNTQFGYDPESVRRAITSEGIYVDVPFEASRRKLVWHEIPIYLAVDLWREYLGKFTFDQLFSFVREEDDTLTGEVKTGMEIILANFRRDNPTTLTCFPVCFCNNNGVSIKL